MNSVSFILPTFNEAENIQIIINNLLKLNSKYNLELIVIDDNSRDGTADVVRKISQKNRQIRLINRLGRNGLSSAIKEGCLNATGEILAVMDTDGQHKVEDISNAIDKLINEKLDIVHGSRFLQKSIIIGLNQKRQKGSEIANTFARKSLPRSYSHITDFMSGCIAMNRETCLTFISKMDVNGFKFLYELFSLSKGILKVSEVPLTFQKRLSGESKLKIAIVWDFAVSLIHTFIKKIIPRRAISFALVGSIGVLVQLISTYSLMSVFGIKFENTLTYAAVIAATSNYLINNWLTFRPKKLKNKALILGLIKFLLVSSLPIIANVGLATSFYLFIIPNTFLSQIAGILVVFIWNYAASSKLVWNY